MESPAATFKMKYHIDLRDIDFTKKLKLSTLFSYFQDIASMAAENIGFGIDTLERKFGVAWILIRMRVDIIRHPGWDEEIIIETWPLEPRKVEFDRDFIVRDQHGNIIIKAISTWVIMDINERKLKRSDLIHIKYPQIIKERAIADKFAKIKSFGRLEMAYQKVIGYSDIDFNGHLNNSKYVDYIMDCFQWDNHIINTVKTIELHFHQ
jgi:medium-chain acyl-[acyl-carrier-protein] hydrolase